jgi:long-chain acyl-CoA synthetase
MGARATEDIEMPPATAALHAATVCEAFQITASARADQVALRTPGGTTSITYGEYAERVRRIAGGLAALGVQRGETVALMTVNRPEFHLADTAAMHLGTAPFSIYNTSSPEQVAYVLSNADCSVAICEPQFVDVIRAANVPGLEHLVVIDGEGSEGTMSLAELERSGDPGFDFEAAWKAVTPDDVLTLIYTSGTTGPPKGVQLTHRNVMAQFRGVAPIFPGQPGGRYLSYLPLAHVADRCFGHYYPLAIYGATVTSVPDVRQVIQVLPEVRPHGWGAVPRIWEKLKAGLEASGVADPAALPEEQKAAIRAGLGLDEAIWLTCGAAPVSVDVLEYFRDLGIQICELFGMSEMSCCVTINPRDDVRIGTVGPPIPGVELRLAGDGELLCRGETLMAGYRNDPARTAEAIDADGWLHTGDIAQIDADGFVRIVDRKKELIINAAGKNMSPANIELRLKSASPLVGQAVCIGDRRPYNVALIVLDPDAAAAWAAANGLADAPVAELAGDHKLRAAIASAVDEANTHLSRVEQIKRHAILPLAWEPGGDELTPTMKLKRRPIAEKYASEIDALYAA